MTREQHEEVSELAEELFCQIVHAETSDSETDDSFLRNITDNLGEEKAQQIAQRSFTYAEAFIRAKAKHSELAEPEQDAPKKTFWQEFKDAFSLAVVIGTFITLVLWLIGIRLFFSLFE